MQSRIVGIGRQQPRFFRGYSPTCVVNMFRPVERVVGEGKGSRHLILQA
jgi:hypothetical protein